MGSRASSFGVSRRTAIAGALGAAVLPAVSRGAEVCTPFELASYFRQEVRHRLDVPQVEGRLYGSMTEMLLPESPSGAQGPQYLLTVDKNPYIQAAFLFWRLMPGHYELVGASPACTGRAPAYETPEGVFEKAGGGKRTEVTFSGQGARLVAGRIQVGEVRLCARAADKATMRWLGSARSDGSVLLPPTLLDFLARHGVLDAKQPSTDLPYPGRLLVVLDSERAERPDWCA